MRPLLPNAVLLNPCAKTSLRAKRRFLRLAALGYGKHPLLAVFIAAGIVSQSTLSRFEESGNIDFLSLILLLKRLGMTPLEFMQYCTDFETGDSDYCLK